MHRGASARRARRQHDPGRRRPRLACSRKHPGHAGPQARPGSARRSGPSAEPRPPAAMAAALLAQAGDRATTCSTCLVIPASTARAPLIPPGFSPPGRAANGPRGGVTGRSSCRRRASSRSVSASARAARRAGAACSGRWLSMAVDQRLVLAGHGGRARASVTGSQTRSPTLRPTGPSPAGSAAVDWGGGRDLDVDALRPPGAARSAWRRAVQPGRCAPASVGPPPRRSAALGGQLRRRAGHGRAMVADCRAAHAGTGSRSGRSRVRGLRARSGGAARTIRRRGRAASPPGPMLRSVASASRKGDRRGPRNWPARRRSRPAARSPSSSRPSRIAWMEPPGPRFSARPPAFDRRETADRARRLGTALAGAGAAVLAGPAGAGRRCCRGRG